MTVASDSIEDESPKTKCLFRLFGQLNATTVPKDLMDELESEFDEPTGITTVKAPELSLDAVLLSQDCGILYEIKHAVGVQCVTSSMLSRSIRLTLSAGARSYMGRSRLVRSCRYSQVRSKMLTLFPDAGLSTLVNFLLLGLFRRQAAQSSSAAGLSRVSRYTFLIQSLLDAISFVGVRHDHS